MSQKTYYYHKSPRYPITVGEKSLVNKHSPFMPNGELWEDNSITQFFNLIDPRRKCVIVDIGAQVGLYTLFAKFLPQATFYSFEPDPNSFELLNENIQLNNITNVHTEQLAISDKVGDATLNTSISHMGLHTMGSRPQRFSDVKPIPIRSTTLDEYFYSRNIGVDFIKIDTEGYEYYILQGGLKTIQKNKPIIQIEYNNINMSQCDVSPQSLNKLLVDLGYGIIAITSEELIIGPIIPLFSNFLRSTGIALENGKIDCKASVPIKRIKLDIGLSYSAPQSNVWLNRESDLLVFGFEPNPESVAEIKRGAAKKDPRHGDPLQTKFLENGQAKIIPCALGQTVTTLPLYITANDVGCSSIYQPVDFPVSKKVDVLVYTLQDFFDLFPFDQHPHIDYIKIDAQGSDLDILKGAGKYLSERVVYVTAEAENRQYHGTDNSDQSMEAFMKANGFSRVYDQETSDPTFLNDRFKDTAKQLGIQCYQC